MILILLKRLMFHRGKNLWLYIKNMKFYPKFYQPTQCCGRSLREILTDR